MFGLEVTHREDLDPELKGTEEGEKELYENRGLTEFIQTLSSSLAEPIHDDVLKHLSLLSLHDACFNLSPDLKPDGTLVSHSSLQPVAMKKAYNLSEEGSLLSYYIDDFVLLDIYKHTGMTIKEWMHLTPHGQTVLKRSVERKKKLEAEATNQLTQQMSEDNARLNSNKK